MRAILLQLALYKLWTLLGWRLEIDGLLFFASVWGCMDVTHHLQTCHPKGAWGSGDDVQYVGSLSRLPKVDNMLK
jgi:hypothetical protein